MKSFYISILLFWTVSFVWAQQVLLPMPAMLQHGGGSFVFSKEVEIITRGMYADKLGKEFRQELEGLALSQKKKAV